MFLLAAFAAVSQSPAPIHSGRAEARVRIVLAVQATKSDWAAVPPNRRREIEIVERGRRTTVRLIEFE